MTEALVTIAYCVLLFAFGNNLLEHIRDLSDIKQKLILVGLAVMPQLSGAFLGACRAQIGCWRLWGAYRQHQQLRSSSKGERVPVGEFRERADRLLRVNWALTPRQAARVHEIREEFESLPPGCTYSMIRTPARKEE